MRINKEQYYTKPEVVDFCLSKLNLKDYETIIEPSAGTGSFSSKIKNCLAFDIEPKADGIIEQDFLKLNLNTNSEKTLIIGNPPFGCQSSLAVKFFNHATTMANTIAFIFYKSFNTQFKQSFLNNYYWLEETYNLKNNSFYDISNKSYSVPCIFQIWKRKDVKRDVKKYVKRDVKINPIGWEFCKREEADFAVKKVFNPGRIYSKNLFEEIKDFPDRNIYFIKSTNKNLIDKVRKIIWDFEKDKIKYINIEQFVTKLNNLREE